MTEKINVLVLVKGSERFIFLYDDANRVETLRTLGRFAANPDLNFTWHDAAFLSQRIRDLAYASQQQKKGDLDWHRRISFTREGDLL